MKPRFELEPHHRNVTDEEFVADLRRVASELGATTVTIDQYNERGQYHASTLSRRFGSSFKAIERAGLEKSRKLNISNKELFQNLIEVWGRLGQQPKYDDLTSKISRFSSGTYEKRFGGWRKALEACVAWANEGELVSEPLRPAKGTTGHKTSRSINYRLRFLVMRRDNFRCRITGRSPATDPSVILEVDHIVPWDKGGETVLENLQTLAKEINIGKSNLPMHEHENG